MLVDFIEGDIDWPLAVGALYNNKGEAEPPPHRTVAPRKPTSATEVPPSPKSTDHTPAAHFNLAGQATGCHSPAWHDAAGGNLNAGGQCNSGALSGVKTNEFHGAGHNQPVFDDSDQQRGPSSRPPSTGPGSTWSPGR